jgi:glyoxylase-like metal-dependent hydrolase (beta-lactamase superfamily II)
MNNLNIERFAVNMLQENCYIVSDETKECVIIDCGAFYEDERNAITSYIRNNGLTPKHLLCTHGHLDHNFGNDTIYREFNIKPEVSERDEKLMSHVKQQASQFYGMELEIDMPPAGKLLADNDLITFGNHTLKVLETPGHSKGSLCFYCEDEHVLFSGDTLFRGSIGRTDLGSGSMMMIIQSLRFLAQLPDDTEVHPGHGPSTTIGYEVAHNPYIDR